MLLLVLGFQALGNPTSGTVTQGSATFNSSGSHFTINQTSANAFINWQSFNIAPGETTTFNQPSANSVAWNQINGANPSQILGNLNANGYVVLENPSGFFIGGQAVLNVHGLVMTTAGTPAMNMADGGPWSFDAPPPAAKIINYGQINITGGGTAYLIASDIVNGDGNGHGSINAPNGNIGLYDGETVLVSTSPNGQGLNAEVTLPQGSVDNEGKLTADGGSVVAQAQFVNQNGIIQADTAQNVNGTIELVGGSSVALGANSFISAQGASQGISSGGSVKIQAGNTFSDQPGSTINVAGGAQGGDGGQVEISAPQMGTINTAIDGSALNGFTGGTLTIDPADIWLDSVNSAPSGYSFVNINSFSGMSQINLQADNDITLNTLWTLADQPAAASLTLTSGGTITVNNSSGISAGQNWTVNLTASSGLKLGSSTVISADYLNLTFPSITSADGNVNFQAIDNITLNSLIALPDFSSAATLSFTAGNDIIINNSSGISAGQNWTVNLTAGTGLDLGSSPVISADNLNLAFPLITSADGNVNFQAIDNITLNSIMSLPDFSSTATLNLTAGNDIILEPQSGILAGQNWNVNLTAGTGYTGTTAPASGSYGIYLEANVPQQLYSQIQTQNGDINLWAADEVQVGWTGASSGVGRVNPGTSSITTVNGGNIEVTAQYGDVNTGADPAGYDYQGTAPYYMVDPNLGGISTAAGGNVVITAGGNVISYLPAGSSATAAQDGGTGAFGIGDPGNVTITAGGNVYGHYTVADGVGTIAAGNNAGASSGDPFALSLIDGGWNVNAGDNIYLQEVRNPNGDFNNLRTPSGLPSGKFLFTYGPQDYVDLTANSVFLTSLNVPRLPNSAVPVLYPSILDINAAAGGVTLKGNVTLFPSVDQNLDITTTDGGNLTAVASSTGIPFYLLMSDSAKSQWLNANSFSATDHGSLAYEPNESSPVDINISGSMENLDLLTTKVTDITIGGNMINCGFSGQNLQAGDVTFINVVGQIYNTSPYSFVNLSQLIPDIPTQDLPNGLGQSWNDIFTLAVNPAALTAELTTLQNQNVPVSQWANALLQAASVFGVQNINGQLVGINPGFVYNPTPGPGQPPQLGFAGPMNAGTLSALTQTVFVLHLANGLPVIDENPSDNSPGTGRVYGQVETDPINWVPAATITALSTDSEGRPALTSVQLGDRIGGPGQFDITAGSISLGSSYGILSCGVYDAAGGFGRYANLTSITPVGAAINVLVTGPDQPATPDDPTGASLNMLTSTIAALGGGNVSVTDTGGSMALGSEDLFATTAASAAAASSHLAYGVYTTGGGSVNVNALGDVDIDGSRIATYNGGDIFITSLMGDVNVGSGNNDLNMVNDAYKLPSGAAASYSEDVFGGGIIAETLVPVKKGLAFPPDAAKNPGSITVQALQGDIVATSAGIIQEALDGSITPGPFVTLTAGTSGVFGGNVDLGDSGVIGGTVNVTAYKNPDFDSTKPSTYIDANGQLNQPDGNVSGQFVSRQNSNVNAAGNFSGTLLAGGSADVSGGGAVSGTIVGVGGVNVSGAGGVTASLLGQNVSVNGGLAQSTLGNSATATSATQSAAQTASSQSQQQVAADQANQEDDKKKKNTQIRKVGRVTIILASAQ